MDKHVKGLGNSLHPTSDSAPAAGLLFSKAFGWFLLFRQNGTWASSLVCVAVADVFCKGRVGAGEAVHLLATVAAQERDGEPQRAPGQDPPVPTSHLPPSQRIKRRLVHDLEDSKGGHRARSSNDVSRSVGY
jgi:hypothetical protein